MHFERIELADQLGIKLRLHFLRNRQFALETLLFLSVPESVSRSKWSWS